METSGKRPVRVDTDKIPVIFGLLTSSLCVWAFFLLVRWLWCAFLLFFVIMGVVLIIVVCSGIPARNDVSVVVVLGECHRCKAIGAHALV